MIMGKNSIAIIALIVIGLALLVSVPLASAAKNYCGDGKCRAGETPLSCPVDCFGAVCGNGLTEIGEQCDSSDLNAQSCTTLGFDVGSLGCNSDCTFDTSGCSYSGEYCGNGYCAGSLEGEDCISCPSDCAFETSDYCGDGTCNSGEDCVSCPSDCASGSTGGGGTCDACFKGSCDGSCHPKKEGSECADCAQPQQFCCGDGFCDSAYCGTNCGSSGTLSACCGDGSCGGSETGSSCETDCCVEETCDGIDNDCDGTVDESLVEQCGSTDVGICQFGQSVCSSGSWGSCVGNIEPSVEVCDGLMDENCNGIVDEGCECINGQTNVCGSTDVGACQFGFSLCTTGTWGSCIGNVEPTQETCDNIDNDCDGSTDDGLTLQCGITDIGVCKFGQKTCNSGAWGACVGNIDPSVEVCDGIFDENCNGIVDEGCECINGQTRECGSNNVGACSLGIETCTNGQWSMCSGEILPTNETCDNIDNDCDGVIDNRLVFSCGVSDVGSCQFGTSTCSGGVWSSCVGNIDPATETCDGTLDENCNGIVDEGCVCVNGQVQDCGLTDLGACEFGEQMCSGGNWGACVGEVNPSTEICDGIDNDCDGMVDEILHRQCGISDVGICSFGIETCDSGMWQDCTGAVMPGTEICDGMDNDCNGETDEGYSQDSCQDTCEFNWTGNGGNLNCCGNDDGEANPFEQIELSCDNSDNDCDGIIDEGYSQDSCQFVCQHVWTGNGGNLNCCGDDLGEAGPYEPEETSCDNNDNDCDGEIDEGCVVNSSIEDTINLQKAMDSRFDSPLKEILEGMYVVAIGSGDLDRDGRRELYVSYYNKSDYNGGSVIMFLEMDPNNGFEKIWEFVTTGRLMRATNFEYGDGDGDGKDELYFSNLRGDIHVVEAVGNNTFQTFKVIDKNDGSEYYDINEVRRVKITDTDSNGKPELVISGYNTYSTFDAKFVIYEHTGTPGSHVYSQLYKYDSSFSIPLGFAKPGIGDFDNDGFTDIIGGGIKLESDGTTFVRKALGHNGSISQPSMVVVKDLDNDGLNEMFSYGIVNRDSEGSYGLMVYESPTNDQAVEDWSFATKEHFVASKSNIEPVSLRNIDTPVIVVGLTSNMIARLGSLNLFTKGDDGYVMLDEVLLGNREVCDVVVDDFNLDGHMEVAVVSYTQYQSLEPAYCTGEALQIFEDVGPGYVPTCGDGICNGGENCLTCSDCGNCCGDNYCDTSSEDFYTCSLDCQPDCHDSDSGQDYFEYGEVYSDGATGVVYPDSCRTSEINGVFYWNVYENYCNDLGSPAFEIFRCPAGCENGACTPSKCGNGVCDEFEDCNTCPGDCTSCCGDGYCNIGETYENCLDDCNLPCEDTDRGWDYYIYGEVLRPGELPLKDYCFGKYRDDLSVYYELHEQYCEIDDSVGEKVYVCPADCQNGACIMDTCGDGFCSQSENCTTCYSDCGSCCGDGICAPDEDYGSCPTDCEPPCIDTDGGKDYFTAGTVNGIGLPFADNCAIHYKSDGTTIDYTVVSEAYCEPNGTTATEMYQCPGLCESGACLDAPMPEWSCVDADGGLNYYTESYASVNGGTNMVDHCIGSTTLKEATCNQELEIMEYVYYDCSSEGKECGDGRCIVLGQEPACQDTDGFDPYTYGVTSFGPYGPYNQLWDYCNTGYLLTENICNEYGNRDTVQYNCSDEGMICLEGVCVEDFPTGCDDSDGGINFDVVGETHVSGELVYYADGCTNSWANDENDNVVWVSAYARESFCNSDNDKEYVDMDCIEPCDAKKCNVGPPFTNVCGDGTCEDDSVSISMLTVGENRPFSYSSRGFVVFLAGVTGSGIDASALVEIGHERKEIPIHTTGKVFSLEVYVQDIGEQYANLIIGENLVSCSSDCGSPPQTYFECVNEQCVEVNGSGTNQCLIDSDCITVPETHLECVNQLCVEVVGTGSDSCSNDNDCIIPCVDSDGGSVYTVKGQAIDATGTKFDNCTGNVLLEAICGLNNIAGTQNYDCTLMGSNYICYDGACIQQLTHSECMGTTCIIVNGTGTNECTDNEDCSGVSHCGDLSCDAGETESICPQDCGTCVDSDNSDNKYIRGSAVGYDYQWNTKSYTDHCHSDNVSMTEYICQSDNKVRSFYLNCLYGCLNGSCIDPGFDFCGDRECNNAETVSSCPIDCGECVDSDGGKNYYEKGTVTGYDANYEPRTFSDYCSSSYVLIEYICWSENIISSENHDCICEDGACK